MPLGAVAAQSGRVRGLMTAGSGSGPSGIMPAGLSLPAQPVFDPGDGVPSVQGAELAKQTSHVAQGIALLIEQFKKKPRIQAMLRSWLKEVDELECAAFDVLLLRSLDTATGAQLDIVGDIVGEARLGRPDDIYEAFIRARISLNNSDGTHEQILEIMRVVLAPQGGTPPTMTLTRTPPAAHFLELIDDILQIDPVDAARMFRLATSAGVGAVLVFILSPPDEIFAFSTTDAIEVDADQGYANDGGTTGGHYAGAAVG